VSEGPRGAMSFHALDDAIAAHGQVLGHHAD